MNPKSSFTGEDGCHIYPTSLSKVPCRRKAAFQVFRWPLPFPNRVAGLQGSRIGICRKCLDRLARFGHFRAGEQRHA